MPRTMTPGGWIRVVNQGTQVSLPAVLVVVLAAGGPVAASSLWPREKDGTPQAFHGMWGTTRLG